MGFRRIGVFRFQISATRMGRIGANHCASKCGVFNGQWRLSLAWFSSLHVHVWSSKPFQHSPVFHVNHENKLVLKLMRSMQAYMLGRFSQTAKIQLHQACVCPCLPSSWLIKAASQHKSAQYVQSFECPICLSSKFLQLKASFTASFTALKAIEARHVPCFHRSEGFGPRDLPVLNAQR